VDFGSCNVVMSTDPITASVKDIGRLSIHISCNDIASNGVEPIGIMLAVMLPVGTTEEDIENMMEQAGKAAASMNVEIIGGHTEITPAVNAPVVVSTAIGRQVRGNAEMEDIKPGDFIVMTKEAGIEGTGILACDYEDELAELLSPVEIAEAQSLLDKVSVVKEGVIAGGIGVTGMHDITEGGVLGAVWEMCRVGDVGAGIIEEDIPVLDITRKVAAHFGIDHLRLISSGCMIMIVRPEKKDLLINAVEAEGIRATCIGRIMEKDFGMQMLTGDEAVEIAPPASDEIYKVVGRKAE